MSHYILSIVLIILTSAFVSWAIAAISGASTTAQSSSTGWGLLIGAVVAGLYYLVTRKR
jgi:hypothetical protein